ncbi:hypothetical protein AURDEDRAFT_162860 [Auricularia subglabra TFB-10046 SS5]|nr:hypothetical protein AURDEDRAFT_162860 [Auricularia subglabra TFB-10046 SS5]
MDDPWANAWTTPATTASAREEDPWKPAVAPVVPTWEPPAWPEDDDPMQAPPIWTAPPPPPIDEDEGHEESSEDDDDDDDEGEPAAQEREEAIEERSERQDEAHETEDEEEQEGRQEPADKDAPATPEEHDAFGSFESAEQGALSPALDLAPDNAWAADAPESAAPATAVSRSLWSPSEWRDEDGQDEWAAASAKQRLEEERERRFPREAVNALISQWDALAAELWPVPEKKPDEKEEAAEDVSVQRLESLPGLPELLESLVPDYHLQPMPQFAKTALFKSLQTSLRMTKSYPMVQQSPLSQFYSSKGNSAWESAVKAKQVVKDDWPWETKPQDAAPVAQPQTEAKPAPARGILGLWRSRPTSMPPAPKGETTPRTASPAPRPSMDKPRPSIDSVRSSGSKDTVATTATTAATSSPVATAPTSPTVSMSSPTSEPAPSAMSRLFGRFSRKSAPAQPSEMTLSNSDLSFLSDVVPSTSGSRLLPEDDILGELSASSMATARLPAPPALPPPPPLSGPPALPKPHASTTAKSQSQGWAFEDDDTDEELDAMQGVIQAGAALDAMLGDGLTGFAQGYAPVAAARNVVAASRAGSSSRHQQRASHTAALPSTVLAAERMNSPLPAPPSAPKRTPAAPPPATLFGGDEFDEFMSMSSPPMPQTRPGQAQPFQSPSAAPLFATPSPSGTPTFTSPAMQGTPTFQTPMMQPTPVFQKLSPAPAPATTGDDFDDFGDFISLPSAPAPAPVPAPQSIAPPPPPPVRRETRLPDPPRIGGRAPVAVMSRTASGSSLSGLPPALAPPPGGSRPMVVMSRGTTPARSSATPPPLLAPPPGSIARKQVVNLMEDANELIAAPVSSHASTASSPVSPVSAVSQSRPASRSSLPPQPAPSLFDDFVAPPRSSLPASPVLPSPRSALPPQTSGALFDDLARPSSRSSLSGGAFSSVPLVSSPLAPTKSPPPRMTSPPAPAAVLSPPPFSSPPPTSGDAFASLFNSAASPPPPAAPQKNGKLSAADLSFFDSL